MKLIKKYLLFNTTFFIFHIISQSIFSELINSNYLLLTTEFIIFSFATIYLFLEKDEYTIILFSISNLAVYLFFIWVIEKSLSIDLLIFMYEKPGPLTLSEVSGARDLLEMTSFRINQGIDAGLINESSDKIELSNSGKLFTQILHFLRELYFAN